MVCCVNIVASSINSHRNCPETRIVHSTPRWCSAKWCNIEDKLDRAGAPRQAPPCVASRFVHFFSRPHEVPVCCQFLLLFYSWI